MYYPKCKDEELSNELLNNRQVNIGLLRFGRGTVSSSQKNYAAR